MTVAIPELAEFKTDNETLNEKVTQLRSFVATVSDPFDREQGPKHMTCSAIVVSSAGVLLHRHKLTGGWMGPGGHIDPGEMPSQSVLREVLEETGVEASHPDGQPRLLSVDIHETTNHHTHLDMTYLLISEPTTPNPPEGESQDVEWFELDKAMAATDGSHAFAIAQMSHLDLRLLE